ncbi:MAG: hypothetical protein CMO01_08450 [Thalassobius sp.]|nr:hypothetical protein [Thalassovita sp.]|tara:strand:- start:174 stop:548 length:375 start_codon:yes stop_codon:yes gene_type:complete
MKTDLTEIQNTLKGLMRAHVPPLQIRKDNENVFELAGTIEAMQGKQKVDGYYFGSVVPKPKDIRLYFFPIYTHVTHFSSMSDALKKFLKGKSCFHIKKLSPELEEEIAQMISLGVELYKNDGLI